MSVIFRLSALLFIVLSGTTGFSQILKVDRADITSDSSYWSGNIDFKLNVNNQSATPEENVTYVGTTFGADLSFIGADHLYMLINHLKYYSTGVGPFVSTGYTHFRVNWLRLQSISYENFAQVQYDRGRNMEWRGLTGGGVKLKIYQAEKSYMHLGIGGMFEQERWKDFEDGVIEKNLWKMTSYLGTDVTMGESATITSTFYYQGGYDGDDGVFRNRVSGDVALKFGISKSLSFIAEFALQYDDKPIIDINNIVYSLTNGLTFNF